MNPKVDEYLSKVKKWQAELTQLRSILLECQLTEELKWRVPCYTFQNTNVFILGGFKEYCVLSFLKGVLMSDTDGLLQKPGENSQSVRFLKFTSIQEIIALEPVIKRYIYEAIEVEKAGLKVDKPLSTNLVFPTEFIEITTKNPEFKAAFEALTPGRQRAYNMHFTAPKQAKTRIDRIEKSMERIFNGKGLNDCVCGLSKRMPSCDGSHKYI